MAKARDIPELHGEMSFRDVARVAVEIRAEELFDHADGVLDTEDIERVHDMRVATRRLRAVLEVFAEAFDGAAHRTVLADVKELADALGARRDPDVQIEAMREFAAAAPADAAAGVELLVGRLSERQARANMMLASALEVVAEHDLAGRLRALADAAEGEAAETEAEESR
jgi:CHAD domain-containing protein